MTESRASSMRIGEAAERAGVNVQTLRYYERTGLLSKASRRPSGYRQYDTDTVRLVHFIKKVEEIDRRVRRLTAMRKTLGALATACRNGDADHDVRSSRR